MYFKKKKKIPKKKKLKKIQIDLLEDLKMSLLNFNFAIIYIIHKMLVMLKNNLNYLIFECFIMEHNILSFPTYNDGKFKP